MSHQEQLYSWNRTLSLRLPSLSKAQAACLALWTLGMVLGRSCALTSVVGVVSAVFDLNPENLRQRLREFYKDAQHKCGKPHKAGDPLKERCELDVQACFCPLLKWAVSLWQGDQIPLALDATTLGERFSVLAISVLLRRCATPVAWCVLPAGIKHAWRKEWLCMLRQLRPAIPKDKKVLVLADRGLYARWLFARIVRLGWHPMLRVNNSCKFQSDQHGSFRAMASFVPAPGCQWSGRGTAFQNKNARLSCTLLAYYGEGHKDPWLVLTDLAPENADVCWYGLRTWIEQGFKFLKRAGWQWNHTRMHHPDRAARLWLATSVATLWLLSEAPQEQQEQEVLDATFPTLCFTTRRQNKAARLNSIGVFRRGLLTILACLIRHEPLPRPSLKPSPWPMQPPVRLNKTKRNVLLEAA